MTRSSSPPQYHRFARIVALPLALATVLASCGGGGSSAAAPAPTPTPLAAPNLANLSAVTLTVNTQAPAITFTNSGGGTLTGCTASSNLPDQLSVDRTTGNASCVISGTPSTATTGAVTVTVTATNATGSNTGTVDITVNPASPAGLRTCTQVELPDVSGYPIRSMVADGPSDLYVRGIHSAWVANEKWRLRHKGDNGGNTLYQAVAQASAADYQGGTYTTPAGLKIANDHGMWTTQFYVPDGDADSDTDVLQGALALGEAHTLISASGGMLNNNVALEVDKTYSFLFAHDKSSIDPAAQNDPRNVVGTLFIEECMEDRAPAAPNLADISDPIDATATVSLDVAFQNGGGGSLLAIDATPTAGCVATGLPSSLQVALTTDGNSCRITGTPDTANSTAATVTVTATNAGGSGSATAMITIAAAAPRLQPPSDTLEWIAGVDVSHALRNIGTDAASCVATGLPTGFMAESDGAGSCRIVGSSTTVTSQDATITITATDAASATGMVTLMAKVVEPSVPASCSAFTKRRAPVAGYPVEATGTAKRLFLRGAHNNWRADADFLFQYTGMDGTNYIYQVAAVFDAAGASTGFTGANSEFKIGADDWGTELAVVKATIDTAENYSANTDGTALALPVTARTVGRHDSNEFGNNRANFTLGTDYLFTLSLSAMDPPGSLDAGTLSIEPCVDDTTPPVITAHLMPTFAISSTAAALRVNLAGSPAKVHYVILPDTDTAPANASAVVSHADVLVIELPTGASTATLQARGLTAGTGYTAYVVAEGQNTVLSSVFDIDFTTAATGNEDRTAPTTSGEALSGTTATTTILTVTSDEAGVLHAVAVPHTTSSPASGPADLTTLMALPGAVRADIPAPSTPATTASASVTIGGLMGGSEYRVFFVAVDVVGNATGVLPSGGLSLTTSPAALRSCSQVERDDAGGYPIQSMVEEMSELYVRGIHSAWVATEKWRLRHKGDDGGGNTLYQVVAQANAADYQGGTHTTPAGFKIANTHDSWTTQFYVPAGDADSDTGVLQGALALGEAHTLISASGGTDNNNVALEDGKTYSFLFAHNKSPIAPAAQNTPRNVVGTLLIEECMEDRVPAAPNLADISDTIDATATVSLDVAFQNDGGGSLLAIDATPTAGCVVTGLPSSLQVALTTDGNSCRITGAPDTANSTAATVTVTATNGGGSGSATAMITVAAAAPRLQAPSDTLVWIAGVDVSHALGNIGTAAASCAHTGLPAGLSAESDGSGSCRIIGAPTSATTQDATITITATDAASATGMVTLMARVTEPSVPVSCSAFSERRAPVAGYPVAATGTYRRLFLRGAHNNWVADAEFLFQYTGMDSGAYIYQVAAAFDAAGASGGYTGAGSEFKIADDDWGTELAVVKATIDAPTDYSASTEDAALALDGTARTVGRHDTEGFGNNRADFTLGADYLFTLSLSAANPPGSLDAGTLSIEPCVGTGDFDVIGPSGPVAPNVIDIASFPVNPDGGTNFGGTVNTQGEGTDGTAGEDYSPKMQYAVDDTTGVVTVTVTADTGHRSFFTTIFDAPGFASSADLSRFAGGSFSFEVQSDDWGRYGQSGTANGLRFKVDHDPFCGCDQDLDVSGIGTAWKTFDIPISDLGGLQLNNIVSSFVLYPNIDYQVTGGGATPLAGNAVTFKIRNVSWVPPAATLTGVAAANVTFTTADINLTSDAAGIAYVAVLADGAPAPAAAAVKAAVAGTGGVIAAANAMATAGTQATVPLAGLVTGTMYDAYVVVEATAGGFSAVEKVDLTTAAAAMLSGVAAANAALTAADINLTSDAAGIAYVAVLADGAAAPDAAAVKAAAAGTGGVIAAANEMVTAGTQATLSLTGLAAGTTYDAYVVVEATAGGFSAVVKVDVDTLSAVDPHASVSLVSETSAPPANSGTPLDIFTGAAIASGWSIFTYEDGAPEGMKNDSGMGQVTAMIVDLADDDHDEVIRYQTGTETQATLGFGVSPDLDAKAYALGTLQFDIRVADSPDDPRASYRITISSHNARSEYDFGGQKELGANTWMTARVDLSDEGWAGLNLAALQRVEVFPHWGAAAGATIELDNIRLYPRADGAPDLVDITETVTLYAGFGPYGFGLVNNGGVGITACSASPALPAGLGVSHSDNGDTCEITGSPTAIAAAANHTITATAGAHMPTATVRLEVAEGIPATGDLDVIGSSGPVAPNIVDIASFPVNPDGGTNFGGTVNTQGEGTDGTAGEDYSPKMQYAVDDTTGVVTVTVTADTGHRSFFTTVFDAPGAADLSRFAGGSFSFEVQSDDWGRYGQSGTANGLRFKVDHDPFCGCDQDLDVSGIGTAWKTFDIPISDLGGLQLNNIISSFVLYPNIDYQVTGGGATPLAGNAVTFKIRNVSWVPAPAAPVLTGVAAANVTATAADINLTSDAAGIAYVAVLADGAAAPTAAAVKAAVAGTGGVIAAANAMATAATQATVPLTGLTAGTMYDAFVVVEATAGGFSAVMKVDVDTPAALSRPNLPDAATPEVATGGMAITPVSLANSGGAATACAFVESAGGTTTTTATLDGLAVALGTGGASCEVTGSLDHGNGAMQTFTVRATNATGDDEADIVFTVAPAAPNLPDANTPASAAHGMAITPVSLANSGGTATACAFVNDSDGEVSTLDGLAVALGNGGASCEVTGSLDYDDGAMQTFTVRATNATDDDEADIVFTVSPPAPSITDATAAMLELGAAITDIVFMNSGGAPATGGCSASTNIPAGLEVEVSDDMTSCKITGTPREITSTPVEVTVTITGIDGQTDTATVSITVQDTTAPIITVHGRGLVADVSATFSITSNEAGTAYILLRTPHDAGDTLNAAAVVAAVGSLTGTDKGVSGAVVADEATNITVSGLTASTAYSAYIVVADASSNNSAIDSTLDITTLATPDTTAPVITGTSVTRVRFDRATLGFSSDDAGTVAVLVLPEADDVPILSAVKTPAMGAIAATGTTQEGGTFSIVLTGLAEGQAYVAYFVVTNASGEDSAVTASSSFTTNNLPEVNAGPDQEVAYDATVMLTGSATDADGNPLGYVWSQPMGTRATPTTPTEAATVTYDVSASDKDGEVLVFRLTVNDGLDMVTDEVAVTVAATPVSLEPHSSVTIMGETTSAPTGSGTPLDIFTGSAIAEGWGILTHESGDDTDNDMGEVTASIEDLNDGSHEEVIRFVAANEDSAIFGVETVVVSPATKPDLDATDYALGTLQFDIRVVSSPDSPDSTYRIRIGTGEMGCEAPNECEYDLGSQHSDEGLGLNVWKTVRVDLSDDDWAGLRLANLLSIGAFPTDATGSTIELDNIRLYPRAVAPPMLNDRAATTVYTGFGPYELAFENDGGVGITSCMLMAGLTLPAGLSLAEGHNGDTCVISGTPTAEATATLFTIIAANATSNDMATVSLTVEEGISGTGAFEVLSTRATDAFLTDILGLRIISYGVNTDGSTDFDSEEIIVGDKSIALRDEIISDKMEVSYSIGEPDATITVTANAEGKSSFDLEFRTPAPAILDRYDGGVITFSLESEAWGVYAVDEGLTVAISDANGVSMEWPIDIENNTSEQHFAIELNASDMLDLDLVTTVFSIRPSFNLQVVDQSGTLVGNAVEFTLRNVSWKHPLPSVTAMTIRDITNVSATAALTLDMAGFDEANVIAYVAVFEDGTTFAPANPGEAMLAMPTEQQVRTGSIRVGATETLTSQGRVGTASMVSVDLEELTEDTGYDVYAVVSSSFQGGQTIIKAEFRTERDELVSQPQLELEETEDVTNPEPGVAYFTAKVFDLAGTLYYIILPTPAMPSMTTVSVEDVLSPPMSGPVNFLAMADNMVVGSGALWNTGTRTIMESELGDGPTDGVSIEADGVSTPGTDSSYTVYGVVRGTNGVNSSVMSTQVTVAADK